MLDELYSMHYYISSAAIAVISIGNAFYLSWRNKWKRARREDLLHPYISDKAPDGGDIAWVELGDQHPDFEYAL